MLSGLASSGALNGTQDSPEPEPVWTCCARAAPAATAVSASAAAIERLSFIIVSLLVDAEVLRVGGAGARRIRQEVIFCRRAPGDRGPGPSERARAGAGGAAPTRHRCCQFAPRYTLTSSLLILRYLQDEAHSA